MNFAKLLWLVLVYSEQFGQVLAEDQIGEDCKMAVDGTAVTCKPRKGQKVKLTITGPATTNVEWKKGTTPISAQAEKYELHNDNHKILTILDLAEGDEGTYTANLSPEQKFQVQVVPVCTGQATKVTCVGKLGGELDLKMGGRTAPFKWHKVDTEITQANSNKYGGVIKDTLTIKSLDNDDEKDFKGTGTGGPAQEFSVQVANCLGATGTVPCQAKLNEPLKLGISDTVSDTVTWVKVDGQLPANNLKVGANDVGLKLKDLKAADVGTYKATYN
ncbi:uncharacterized protein ACBT44_009303 [Syngnathus typhle]